MYSTIFLKYNNTDREQIIRKSASKANFVTDEQFVNMQNKKYT